MSEKWKQLENYNKRKEVKNLHYLTEALRRTQEYFTHTKVASNIAAWE